MEKLNEQLADFPYVGGYTPSQADLEQLKTLPKDWEKSNFVHLKRWAKHLSSFTEGEKKAFPGTPGPSAAKKGGDDDDDFDLFGSDDEEATAAAEKAKAERAKKLEEQKKGGKPGVVAKSSVILDVKVWDDETDLKEVEAEVRKIQQDGLLWGVAKTVPLAFGISKLQIVAVVEDEKISVQDLTDKIEELELVQSTDIAAFQKI